MNSKSRLMSIVLISIIALIVIGGGLFIVKQKNNSNNIQTNTTSTQDLKDDANNIIRDDLKLLTQQQIQQRLPNIDKFPKDPKSIVVMEYSFLGDLIAVGLNPVGIADDNKPDSIIPEFSKAISGYTSIGSRYQPSLEAIADLKPDLIIADQERHTVIEDELNQIAPAIVLKSRGESYEENLHTAQLVGHIVHQDQKMEQAITTHIKTMQDLRAKLASTPIANQKVQFAIISDKGMWMHGPSSYAGSLLNYLNIKSPIPDQTNEAYIATSLEQLVAADPDWLLIGRYNEHTLYDDWQSSPLFNQLTAVKKHQVIEVDPTYWALNRSMQSAEHMARELLTIANQPSALKGNATSPENAALNTEKQ